MEATRRTLIAALLAGCVFVATASVLASSWAVAPPQSGRVTAPGENPPSTSPGPVAPPPMRLALSLRTDRSNYTIGDTAHLTTFLTNLGNGTVVLHLPNPCSVVFLAYDEGGEVVFNSTSPCIQVTVTVTLVPGASEAFRYDWPLVTANGTPVPAPASYRLVPMFEWSVQYQGSVVRTDAATIRVDGRTIV